MYFDIHVHMYKYDYVMGFHLMVMLRSTTGSYGQPVIEIAYGEMIFHSTETVSEMVAREEWLGCRHDASSMFDISGCGLHIYVIFFDFHDIKAYILF